MTDKIVVLSTCESEEEAARVARQLVEKRLAACVTILPQARSVYRWPEKSGPEKSGPEKSGQKKSGKGKIEAKDKIEDASEFVLLIKSRRDLFDALRAEIVKIHSYEIPEVIALPVVDGSAEYLAWLDRELIS